MTNRALSTALDVSLCVLLVSAAVVTLSTIPADRKDPGPSPAATLGVLGSVTNPYDDRHHATPLERLAAAALRDARLGSRQSDRQRQIVRDLLNRTTGSRQVSVRWEPVPGLAVRGEVEVGPDPPQSAAVDTVRTIVPLGRMGSAAALDRAAEAGFDRLALRVAHRILPRLARPCRDVADVRHGRCNTAERSGERLETLADRVQRALDRRYDGPQTARLALSLARVTVIVRTWTN